jgi:signal transduction histidine kinase
MKKIVSLVLLLLFLMYLPALHSEVRGNDRKNGRISAPKPKTSKPEKRETQQQYQQQETQMVINLVHDASELVRTKGEAAFNEFRVTGSKWRKGDSYIFVLDPEGNMLVHPDPKLEGKNQLELKSINGKSIIRGILNAVSTDPGKPEGWFHYQWPVPGGITPRWKSTYARQVKAPSGKTYIMCSGMYNDRMEKEFAVDLVKAAVAEIEKKGKDSFPLFHDKTGPYLVKDAYILVINMDGVELVNPAFPSYEGKNVLDEKDAKGKFLIREMLKVAQEKGSGWVNYLWPKPGESVPSQKSTYVSKAKLGDKWIVVGCGVYLEDAPKATAAARQITAPERMKLVREAAALLAEQGEKAYSEFRKKGTKWFNDDTYFFIWTLDGTRVLHAAIPGGEGKNEKDLKDPLGRPIGKMFLDIGSAPNGEGWVHYMWPEPGKLFPTWKSTFVKRVAYPSGKQYLVGSGVYDMQMDNAFIEDLVNRAAKTVSEQGKKAFDLLRDKTGPYIFMETYVFVITPEGVELVNAAQPSLEDHNLLNEKDLKGKLFVQEYLNAASQKGSTWTEYYWYKPGEDKPALKRIFVKKVQAGGETYILGAGYFPDQTGEKQKLATTEQNKEKPDSKKK